MKRYRGLIVAILLIGLGLGYYAYLSNRTAPTPAQTQSDVSDADKLIAKDIAKNYPNTPVKVVELYSDIMVQYYSSETDDVRLEKLVKQSMMLFDEELLAQNPEQDLIKNTKAEVADYREKKQTITTYIVQSSKDVEYYTDETASYCTVTAEYFIRNSNGGFAKTYEDYMLRKDEFGKWKILGWQLTMEEE